MKKNNLCILGYDGLDINLVEKFDLPNLKQEEYGKTNISEFDKNFTPILWGSFLIGRPILKISSRRAKLSNKVHRLAATFSKFILDLFNSKRKKLIGNISIPSMISGEDEVWNIKILREDTFLDSIEKDKTIIHSVPPYTAGKGDQELVVESISDEGNKEKYVKEALNKFEDRKKILLNNLDKKLIMVRFALPDTFGHMFRPNLEKMFKCYSKLDQLTKGVKEKFDGWILTIADHGMESLGRYGDHMELDYGFYSSNIKLGLDNPKLTDFYRIIRKRMKK